MMNYTLYPKIIARSILTSIIAVLFFASCQKTVGIIETPTPPLITLTADLTTKVSSSVSGFVTDENELPVKNANVVVGTSTTITDKYGYFEARNVQVVQNAAMVTIIKPGYFKGIKTYIATAGKSAFFRIKLITKVTSGTLNATTGGTVTLASNLSILFPAAAFVNASTNVAYTGTVKVAAFKIDPTSADLPRIMPGDLRGLNIEGNLQILTSYGMAAVELTGTAGELLQIAAGKKATMTMPIPTTIIAFAPATIPLWYFNETNGLWKQEGTATKVGNNYVGDVSHFSFWNYDVPANFVQFNCTVVNGSGQPIPNVQVKISLVSNPNSARYGYTDSAGYVGGAVPNNALLLLEVFGNNGCNVASYSQTFTTTNVNVSLGAITISTATSLSIISGIVTNCSNAPVTNGFIIIQNGYLFSRHALSATGTYSVNRLLCGTAPNNVTLTGEDITAAQQSNPAVYPIVAGVNTIPTIQACGVSIQQFVNYTINSTPYNYSVPTDSLILTGAGSNTDYYVFVGNTTTNNGTFRFVRTGIAVGSVQNLISFTPFQIPATSIILNPIGVNITEYGAVGQYVAGNFSGVVTGPPPTNTIYNVTCNFRIKRNF
ncbi:MAG: carboxypeptidase-like regulatory domain-containing protein [Ferruginibacter sp.]|nr:carboxypeptidase-like regulatory domain-containing protein [Ferruginibacter sp.]